MKKLLLISPPNDLEKEFCELVAQDFEVVNALDEKQGFEILDDDYEGISAVLVDLATTRSTDFEILRLMDQDKIFASIPVIALADHLPTPEDMDVFEKGFSELLTPPGLRQFVVNRINNAIRAKDSFTYTEMQKMLKQLPSNIYLKDAQGRYVFCTQYCNFIQASYIHGICG